MLSHQKDVLGRTQSASSVLEKNRGGENSEKCCNVLGERMCEMNRKFPCPRMLEANNNQASPSAKIGTVELTGLDIIKKMAEGQCFAQASASPETMPALVLKRSSRVIPGFLGTPTKFRCQIVRFR